MYFERTSDSEIKLKQNMLYKSSVLPANRDTVNGSQGFLSKYLLHTTVGYMIVGFVSLVLYLCVSMRCVEWLGTSVPTNAFLCKNIVLGFTKNKVIARVCFYVNRQSAHAVSNCKCMWVSMSIRVQPKCTSRHAQNALQQYILINVF